MITKGISPLNRKAMFSITIANENESFFCPSSKELKGNGQKVAL